MRENCAKTEKDLIQELNRLDTYIRWLEKCQAHPRRGRSQSAIADQLAFSRARRSVMQARLTALWDSPK